ncbi:hypothetical protein C8T65DRAFT_827407 [Cerioporus squamosus]|nr:hypothetical protein C8T65DRAFT_827407 [Cerioporus squamosus]
MQNALIYVSAIGAMLHFKVIKKTLSRYINRLKGLRRHRRRYQTTALTDPQRRPLCPGPATSVGDLPVELFHQVMTIIHERDTIVACSLVSQRWRAVALPYLFSTMTVREAQDFDAFLSLMAEAPHISPCIRTLTLAGDGEGGARLDCSGFSALFPSLTRLRQLFLQDITLRVPAVGDCDGSPSNLHGSSNVWLEALEVDDVRCEDPEGRALPVIPTVFDMVPVSSVYLLRFDGLGDVADEENTDFQVGIPSRTIDVRHLSVVAPDGAATAAYLAFYEKLIRIGSLRCLGTFCEMWGDAERLAAFLRVQGSSITTVDLDITRLMEQERRHVQLPRRRWHRLAESFCACTNILSLRLHIPWNTRDVHSFVHPSYSVFTDLFSVALPPTLHDFEIWLKLPQDWGLADAHTTSSELWDLSTLDRILCDCERFPDLQRVLVIIQTSSSVAPGCVYALEGRIAEREWPRVDGRGLLSFQWYTPVSYEEQ